MTPLQPMIASALSRSELPTSAWCWSGVIVPPPQVRMSRASAACHDFSESTSVPSKSHSKAAGTSTPGTNSAGIEVLRLRVVDDQRVGGLLGVQLELLAQHHADALGLEQGDQLRAVLEVGQAG